MTLPLQASSLLLGRTCSATALRLSLVKRCFCSSMHTFVVPVQQELQHLKSSEFLKGMSVSCLGYYTHPVRSSNHLNICLAWVSLTYGD